MASKFVVTKINTFKLENKVYFADSMTEAVKEADAFDQQELMQGDLEGDWIIAEILPRGGWYVRAMLWLESKFKQ
jgi:hypothetical protein